MALGTPVLLGTAAYAGANVPSVQVTPSQFETQAAITTAAPVAAGALILVAVAFDVAQPAVVVTDSAGNVYGAQPDASKQNPSGLVVQLFSCANCKALPLGGTITVSLPGAPADSPSGIVPQAVPAPTYLCAAALAVTGVAPWAALDVQAQAAGNGTAPNSGSAASGTLHELVVGLIGWERTASPGQAESLSWTSGLGTLVDLEVQNGSAGRAGLYVGYVLVAALASFSAAGTLGNADQWTAIVATYRAESDAAAGEVYVNGAPLAAGRTGYVGSGAVNRLELRGLVDFDGQLLTDVSAQPQLQINNAAGASVLATTSMDYRAPGVWGLDVADSVWVHGAGPWTCVLTVQNAALSKLLATYRFTVSDLQN